MNQSTKAQTEEYPLGQRDMLYSTKERAKTENSVDFIEEYRSANKLRGSGTYAVFQNGVFLEAAKIRKEESFF